MDYIDSYQRYLEQIPDDIKNSVQSGKKHVFGYTDNVDVLLKWDAGILNGILEEFLEDEPFEMIGGKIATMSDFARVVSYYAINGLGGESDIADYEVCRRLEEYFETRFSLGGTCAQGAAAINAMGFPVVLHITDKSREACRLLGSPGIYTVSEDGVLVPAEQAWTGAPPVLHIVLQFPKGDRIVVHGREYTIPESNRVILCYDEKVENVLPLAPAFLDYCETNAESIDSYGVSGFNNIISQGVLQQRLQTVCEHYRKVKAKNPRCVIQLECAYYHSTESKLKLLKQLSPYIDIFGMNEEELEQLSRQLGKEIDHHYMSSILEGLEFITELYGLNGIVLHTKDYSMYCGKQLTGIDIEKGLTLGNLMSATRARTGRYGSYEDCKESLKIGLSKTGLQFAHDLKGMKHKTQVCFVPSKYMEHPNYTIGLGDTFTAGVQICLVN